VDSHVDRRKNRAAEPKNVARVLYAWFNTLLSQPTFFTLAK